jgi:O-antigen ligase
MTENSMSLITDSRQGSLARLMNVSAGELSIWILYFLTLIIASDGSWSTIISGLFPALFLAPAMYLLAWRQGWHRFTAVNGTAPIGVILLSFCFFATLSTLANPLPEDGWLVLLGCYVMPALLFYAVSVLRFNESQIRRVLLFVAFGSLIPLLWGALEFYKEFGIPTGVDLLESRYNISRMEGYMSKTFGNTGNTAAFLAILMPTVGAALVTYWRDRRARALLGLALLVALVHVLIVQSRTLFIVLCMAFPVIALFYRLRFGAISFLLLVAVAAIVIPVLTAVDQFVENTVGAAAGLNDDNSVSERFEAMHAAYLILRDHLSFGVGPGNSLLLNPFTSAHEYILQQGSEIGVVGIPLAILLTGAYVIRVYALFRVRVLDPYCKARFAMMIGPVSYFIYGVIANMPLAQNVETPWVGLTSLLAGASFAYITPGNKSNTQTEFPA